MRPPNGFCHYGRVELPARSSLAAAVESAPHTRFVHERYALVPRHTRRTLQQRAVLACASASDAEQRREQVLNLITAVNSWYEVPSVPLEEAMAEMLEAGDGLSQDSTAERALPDSTRWNVGDLA
eukprot:scaffold1798_cov376-Prasinococcus_capsulatus_cf.AAC.6